MYFSSQEVRIESPEAVPNPNRATPEVVSVPSLQYPQVGLLIHTIHLISKYWILVPVSCLARDKIHPRPPLPKEMVLSPLFKEGVGGDFSIIYNITLNATIKY